MRKSLAAVVLLLALSLGLAPWICGRVDDEKDKVEIAERIVWGDPAKAQGLTIQESVQMADHLRWDIELHPGTEWQRDSQFRFARNREDLWEREYDRNNYLQIYPIDLNVGVSGHFDIEELKQSREDGESEAYSYPLEILEDVASRTAAGQYHAETVKLKDYYELLPWKIDNRMFSLTDGEQAYSIEFTQKNREELTAYLAVETPEDAMLQVELSKDEEGNIYEISWNMDGSEPNIQINCNAVTQQGGYFVISKEGDIRSRRLDEDYGIYYLPFQLTETEGGWPAYRTNTAELQNVFPLGSDVDALDLRYDENQQHLLLLTRERGRLWMTVIEESTKEPVQKLELGAYSEEEGIMDRIVQGDQITFILQNREETENAPSTRVIFLKQEGDRWNIKLQADQENVTTVDDNDAYYLTWTGNYSCVAWDETTGRLAMTRWGTRYESSSWVLVYDREGLLYAAEYTMQGAEGAAREYDHIIHPNEGDRSLIALWE